MKRALLLTVIALAICLGATAVASAAPTAPYTANSDCLFCHDTSTGSGATSKVEFDVPAAMQSRCNSCHSSPYHWSHYGGNTCGGCHPGRPELYALYGPPQYSSSAGNFQSSSSLSASPQTLHAIHANGSVWQYDSDGIDGTQCNTCHAPASCASCHGTDPDSATHTSHTNNDPAYPPVTYTQSVGWGTVTTAVTCVNASCHSLANAATTDFVPQCGTCHPTRVEDHGYDAGQHTADVTSTVDGGGKVCGDCHDMALYVEHTKSSASSAVDGCGACHPTPRDTFAGWNQTCQQAGCHAAASATEPHASEAASHTPLATGDAAVCGDCHEGSLDLVHADATSTVDPTKTSCLVCHSKSAVPATKDCTQCHFTYDNHPYPADAHLSDSTLANCGGAGCHTTRDLLGAHQEKNPAYTCGDCHDSPRSEVQNAIAAGLTKCSDCHPDVSEDTAHYAQHEAVPPLVSGPPAYAPNYAFYTGSAPSGLYTSDCASCHVSNLIEAHLGSATRPPQYDSSGVALDCDTCHASIDTDVIASISGGYTKCDGCHENPMTGGPGVHGPINATHQSAFMDAAPVKCTPCHETNIADQHNGGQSWPDADGKPLVGCEVCHKNFAGPRGQQVQAAIEPLDDTRCTACHASTHPDFNSHTATTPASLDCSECHADGQTSIDVKTVHENASIGPCAVCHDNSGRVPDIRNETAECASCHAAQGTDYHRNFTAAHNAPDSQACVECHETATATTLHAGIGDGCAVCHSNPGIPALPATTACVNCHSDESPVDPDHYTGTETTHTASDATQYGYACSTCHKLEMKPEHVKASSGTVACVTCHETKVDNLSGAWNDTCAACHGVQHGGYDAAHVSSQVACAGSGCHDITNVRTIHSDASTVTPSGTLTDCRVCHQNSDSLPTTTDCYGCHAGHGDLTAAHTAATSGDCTSCHETGDVRTVHANSAKGDCEVCHDNPAVPVLPQAAECVNCHSVESPADPDHYTGTEATHSANDGTESGFACSQCHKLEMKPEHVKSTSGSVNCVQCHETKVDNLSGAWNKTCAACHAMKHTAITTTHNATGIGNADDCGGAGCHQITDLRAIHANSVPGNAPTMGDDSCATAECHTSDTTIPTKKSCDSTGCHAGTQPHKHELNQAGSAYISDSGGGCTGAGAGCHGAGSDPSYAPYHPASGCTTGDCHTASNHNAAQFNDPNTCQNCHGGGATLYDGAANVSSLLGSSPGGHYVDQKHSPAVNNESMRGATGGTVIGYCRDCHNPSNATGPDGLYIQHRGIAVWNGKVCSECHNDSGAVSAVVNSDWSTGLCSECHETAVLPSASQHSTGTAPAVNATEAQGAGSCVTAGCHLTLDLHALHKGTAATPADSELRTQGCAAGDCHDYSLQAAKPNKKSCGSGGACHGTDPHDPLAHNASASSECLACHEAANNTATTDIRAIVRTNGAAVHACATCHNSGSNLGATNTAQCVDCHNGTEAGTHVYSPVDPDHYAAPTHLAANGTEDGYACSSCHSLDMKTEHAKPGSGPVGCTQCHETKVDGFTATWNDQCSACHATRHTNKAAGHTSTNTSCGGTGCHAINDVSSIHATAPNNCGTCHTPTSTPTSNCSASGCHPNTTGNHEAQHNTAGVIDAGCKGCHFEYLTTEHSKLGYTCATCHDSTNSAVQNAIATQNRDCDACHPAVNGRDRHANQKNSEFVLGNSSGHRAYSELPGMRSSFKVGATTYTWSLPTTSSFLKTGWTTDSMVTCDKCHTYTGTNGPHGGSVTINIDPAYPGDYTTAYLNGSSASPSNLICSKCHTNYNGMNQVHGEGDHQGSSDGRCTLCHTKVPHSWRLPRLLAYRDDPATYASTGLTGVRLANHSPNNWSESDCSVSCGEHSSSMSGRWPSVVNTVGNLSGTVVDEANQPVSGATVTTDKGNTATTDALGKYGFVGVSTGAYTVTVAKSGFVTQSRLGTVNTNQTTSVNFTLVAIKPGTLVGTVTDSDTLGALSGVTVQVTGDGSTTTAANGTYSLSVMPGSYTLTYSLPGYVSQTKSVTITSNSTTTQNVALARTPTNLALNKTVTQSSQYSSTYSGAKAVDGSASSYWRSSSSGTQWIVVDLGSTQSIKEFVIDWNSSYYARSYRIETASSSSGPWTQQFSQSSSSTGDRTVTLANAVSARYVRVYCTSAYQSNYRLAEFQVWGQ